MKGWDPDVQLAIEQAYQSGWKEALESRDGPPTADRSVSPQANEPPDDRWGLCECGSRFHLMGRCLDCGTQRRQQPAVDVERDDVCPVHGPIPGGFHLCGECMEADNERERQRVRTAREQALPVDTHSVDANGWMLLERLLGLADRGPVASGDATIVVGFAGYRDEVREWLNRHRPGGSAPSRSEEPIPRCEKYTFWEGFSVRCAREPGHTGQCRGWKELNGWPGPEQPSRVNPSGDA